MELEQNVSECSNSLSTFFNSVEERLPKIFGILAFRYNVKDSHLCLEFSKFWESNTECLKW